MFSDSEEDEISDLKPVFSDVAEPPVASVSVADGVDVYVTEPPLGSVPVPDGVDVHDSLFSPLSSSPVEAPERAQDTAPLLLISDESAPTDVADDHLSLVASSDSDTTRDGDTSTPDSGCCMEPCVADVVEPGCPHLRGEFPNLKTNEFPDTAFKIDSVMAMVAFKGGSLCILGGASKKNDTRVKMITPYIKSCFSRVHSVDPRFKKDVYNPKESFHSCSYRDHDLKSYDVVFSDMYFDDRCNSNDFGEVLERAGDKSTVVVKLTSSSVDLAALHSMLSLWKSFKILGTIASGTSSEFFVVVYKKYGKNTVPSSVPVCSIVNDMYAHVNNCKICLTTKPRCDDIKLGNTIDLMVMCCFMDVVHLVTLVLCVVGLVRSLSRLPRRSLLLVGLYRFPILILRKWRLIMPSLRMRRFHVSSPVRLSVLLFWLMINQFHSRLLVLLILLLQLLVVLTSMPPLLDMLRRRVHSLLVTRWTISITLMRVTVVLLERK